MNTNTVYHTVYECWKAENASSELTKLPENFYHTVVEYLKKAKEEARMIDLKTLKASLLKTELENVKQMVRELAKLRCMKLTQMWLNSEKIPSDLLTAEEENFFKHGSNFAREYQNFIEGIIQRQTLTHGLEHERKNIILRFLEDTPAIVGIDLKTYGPFKKEDVASLPVENAKILVQRGLAKDISLFTL